MQAFTKQNQAREKSALTILPLLFDHFLPNSVIDIGCGVGTWLAAAQKLGVKEIRGVEGPELEKSLLRIEPDLVSLIDLETPFDLGRKFDLAICLEVAEHLSPDIADQLVECLTRHADLILFSAAIPFQGGHQHVNEQWPSYWNAKFHQHDFVVIDFIRAKIWSDRSVFWWLRQNILVFARSGLIQSNPKLAALNQRVSGLMPLDLAHPTLYTRWVRYTRWVDRMIAIRNKLLMLVERLSSRVTRVVGRERMGTSKAFRRRL